MMLNKHFFNCADLLIQDAMPLWTTKESIGPMDHCQCDHDYTYEELFGKLIDLAMSPACTLAMPPNNIHNNE